jgi:hypothetical protein
MSESTKNRIGKMEAAIAPKGCCPTCGRAIDDEKERARLNSAHAAANPIDYRKYAALFDIESEVESEHQ